MYNWDLNKIPILQLGPAFYDEVTPAVFPMHKLRYQNPDIVFDYPVQNLANFNPLPANLNTPLALRYHGHQFQHYNPDLGDGRGFLYAQIKIGEQWYDLGTKGSGQTPYSRNGDGRLTLKGAVRESLATEMLESLGVKTSRTLCFYETGESLQRNDEPSPTRSAVLTRFSLGHIRIGTFQRLAYLRETENIKKLVSYCMSFYYRPDLLLFDNQDENLLAARFLQNVVTANARLVAQIMIAGFVHGVLNTDNINIAGELFDYGPYRFMPEYDPDFTAAYFDHQGLYCFGRQPVSFLWGLTQLGGSLKTAYPDLPADEILADFSPQFNEAVQIQLLKRLNLIPQTEELNAKLLASVFNTLENHKLPFEQVFFDLHSKRHLQKYQDISPELVEILHKFSIASEKNQNHEYFLNPSPTTLLIDEIESLWKPIAENDDWSLYEKKLRDIRKMRGVYS